MGLSGVALCGIDNNTFVQIGSAGLIGLACKNAVLRGMLGVTTCSLFLTPVFLLRAPVGLFLAAIPTGRTA
jgi:multidrug efflux pump subunit AcrB